MPAPSSPGRSLRWTVASPRSRLVSRTAKTVQLLKPLPASNGENAMRIPNAVRLFHCLSIAILASALAACHSGGGGDSNPGAVQIKTLSNRADLISGGNAYVEIVVPEGKAMAGLSVAVSGRDVTSAFAVRASGRITGVVTGLAVGDNFVVAGYQGGATARLTINNHPIGGPVLTGVQTTPFICATPAPLPATATSPATHPTRPPPPPLDRQSHIPTPLTPFSHNT